MPRKKPVQIELEKKPYYEYVFLVLREDYDKAQKSLSNIYSLIQKSKPVPAALIKEFANYLHDKNEVIRKSNSIELTNITEKTIAFFSSNKDYQFHAERYDEKEKEQVIFNFKACIEFCLVQYWATMWVRKQIGQEDNLLYLIRFLFKVLKEYTAPFDKSDKPEGLLISDYKKVVIGSYLCERLGNFIPHDDDDKPSIPEYYKVGRNVIRKKNEIKKSLKNASN